MTTFRNHWLLIGMGVAMLALPACVEAGGGNSHPNIVVFLADDQRADYLGCAGHPIVKTPNIDALAERGTYFENAFVTSAACMPSRTCILTGQYERKHGVTFGCKAVMTEAAFDRTYPMILKRAGYYVGYIGKNHTPVGRSAKGFGADSGVMEREFDYWYGNHGHARFYPKKHHPIYRGAKSDTQVEIFEEGALNFLSRNPEFAAANQFLNTRPADKPFCLLINFNVPHGAGTESMKLKPTDPPLYRTAYRDQIDEMPLPKTYIAEKDIQTPKIPRNVYNGKYISQYDYVKAIDTLRERQVRTCQTITGIDRLVGHVVAELQRQGLDDNTIILYFSDHGLLHGEHGLGGKVLLYEESIRVPLIIVDPRLPSERRGQRVSQMALSIDLCPTLLALAGVDAPATIQGRSLKPLLYENQPTWRKDFFLENMFMGQNYPRIEGVRSTRWKYIRYFDKSKDQPHFQALTASIRGEEPIYEELYDLANDPNETVNLAQNAEHRATLQQMRHRYRELLLEAKGGDAPPDTYVLQD